MIEVRASTVIVAVRCHRCCHRYHHQQQRDDCRNLVSSEASKIFIDKQDNGELLEVRLNVISVEPCSIIFYFLYDLRSYTYVKTVFSLFLEINIKKKKLLISKLTFISFRS